MLEAVTKDLVFTISLKRSTQNLQLSTSWAGRLHHLLALLYGPAVRCKLDLMIWRRLVLRFCVRPLHGAFVLLAIMDIRAHPISFSDRP